MEIVPLFCSWCGSFLPLFSLRQSFVIHQRQLAAQAGTNSVLWFLCSHRKRGQFISQSLLFLWHCSLSVWGAPQQGTEIHMESSLLENPAYEESSNSHSFPVPLVAHTHTLLLTFLEVPLGRAKLRAWVHSFYLLKGCFCADFLLPETLRGKVVTGVCMNGTTQRRAHTVPDCFIVSSTVGERLPGNEAEDLPD